MISNSRVGLGDIEKGGRYNGKGCADESVFTILYILVFRLTLFVTYYY